MTEEQKTDQPLEILVIDNDEGVRQPLSFSIPFSAKKLGITAKVTTAIDGVDGAGKFATIYSSGKPYDLVLTDWNMPNRNGLYVLEKVKELSRHTPVLLMTDSVDECCKLLKERPELKPDGYLEKPIGNPDIEYLLKWFMELRKSPENPPQFKQPINLRKFY